MGDPAIGGEPRTVPGDRPAADVAVGPLSRTHRATTLPVLAFITLIAFETIAVATAMPVAAADLGGVRSYGLAFSSFLTASLLGTVLAGSWADARGPRAPIATGAVLFVLGQTVCAAAPVFAVLLLGRLLAGLGGGLVVVAIYVVVGATFPDAVRPKVFGWISAAWVLPGIVGPALAGRMADTIGWRWVFGAVVPVAVVVAVVIVPRVSARPAAAASAGRGRVWRGLLLAGGAGAVQVGAQSATEGVAPVLLTAAGAAAVLVALPGLLPRGTLRAARGLPSVVAVRGLFTGAFFGTEAFVPLMLVSQRGFSASEAGLALTGGTLGWFTGTTLQARRLDRLPRATLLVLGGVVLTAGIATLVLLTALGASGWWVLLSWLVAGGGMGLGMATTSVLTLRLASPAERGLASSALQLSDNLGSVLGIAVAGAVFAALHDPGRDEGLFAGLYGGLAVLAVLAAVVGARARPTPRRDAAAAPASSTVERS